MISPYRVMVLPPNIPYPTSLFSELFNISPLITLCYVNFDGKKKKKVCLLGIETFQIPMRNGMHSAEKRSGKQRMEVQLI